MLPAQMLSGQMLLRQLKSIQYSPMNLRLKFRQNRVNYSSWDIADIEILWVGGVVCIVIFVSNPTKIMLGWGWVELWLSWGFDNTKNEDNQKEG